MTAGIDLNMDSRPNPGGEGSGLGFVTLEQERTIEQLPLTGSLPPWLRGSLLRTGPARFEVGGQSMRHWFDGLAMLHRFTITDGRVSYGNRFLESRSYKAAREQGRMVYGEFATDPCRSLFKRVQTLFSPGSVLPDNANINITRLGERFIAMTETPLPSINYGRCNERPYRYVWGNGNGEDGWLEQILKIDTTDGATLSWSQPGCYPGEPVFVARPEAEDEDDGVLLSVVLDAEAETSFLLVLDAADLSELARAQAPHHIPFGFHGQFAWA